jgi:hypothetical protein
VGANAGGGMRASYRSAGAGGAERQHGAGRREGRGSNCGAMHTLCCCGAAAWITTWTPKPVGCIFLSLFLRCLLGLPTYLALVFSVHPFISFLYCTTNSLPFFRCCTITDFHLLALIIRVYCTCPSSLCQLWLSLLYLVHRALAFPLTLSLPHLVHCSSLAPPTFLS